MDDQEISPIAPPASHVPWTGSAVAASFLAWFALQFLVGSVVMVATATPQPEGATQPARPSPRAILGIMALANGLTIPLVPRLLRKLSGATWADLGIHDFRTTRRGLRQGFAASLVVLPAIYAVMYAATSVWPPKDHSIATTLRGDTSPTTVTLAILGAVILGPIAEELLFRGVLLGWLTRFLSAGPEPFWAANLFTAILFAGLHVEQWPAPIPLFVLALILGEARRRTGNLAVPIALHMALNGVSTAELLRQTTQAIAMHHG